LPNRHTLNEHEKPTSEKWQISFVVSTKILGEEETKLGNGQATTITELADLLNDKCGGLDTQTTLLKAPNECREGNKTVEKFAEELLNLTERLTSVEVRKLNLTGLQAGAFISHKRLTLSNMD
jgi:hypothetical protein